MFVYCRLHNFFSRRQTFEIASLTGWEWASFHTRACAYHPSLPLITANQTHVSDQKPLRNTAAFGQKRRKKNGGNESKTRNEIKQKYASSRSAPQSAWLPRPAGEKIQSPLGEQKGKAPTNFLAAKNVGSYKRHDSTTPSCYEHVQSFFFSSLFFCPGQRRLYALSRRGRAIKKQKGQANVWPKPRGSRRDWST